MKAIFGPFGQKVPANREDLVDPDLTLANFLTAESVFTGAISLLLPCDEIYQQRYHLWMCAGLAAAERNKGAVAERLQPFVAD